MHCFLLNTGILEGVAVLTSARREASCLRHCSITAVCIMYFEYSSTAYLNTLSHCREEAQNVRGGSKHLFKNTVQTTIRRQGVKKAQGSSWDFDFRPPTGEKSSRHRCEQVLLYCTKIAEEPAFSTVQKPNNGRRVYNKLTPTRGL